MKKNQLWTTTLTLTLGALTALTACSEGDDGDTTATGGTTGDGDGTGGTPAATGGGGGAPAGTGGTTTTPRTPLSIGFDAGSEGAAVDFEEELGMGGAFSTSVSYDDTDGDPAGSVKIEIPFDFTGDGSYDGLQKSAIAIPVDPAQDLTGATVSVDIKLVSGQPGCGAVRAKMFVKDSAFVWANGPEQSLVEGAWIEASLEASDPEYNDPGFDPTSVVMAGIEVIPAIEDGCATTGSVVVLMDNFSL